MKDLGYDCFDSTEFSFPVKIWYSCNVPKSMFNCHPGSNATLSNLTKDDYDKYVNESYDCHVASHFVFPINTIYICQVPMDEICPNSTGGEVQPPIVVNETCSCEDNKKRIDDLEKTFNLLMSMFMWQNNQSLVAYKDMNSKIDDMIAHNSQSDSDFKDMKDELDSNKELVDNLTSRVSDLEDRLDKLDKGNSSDQGQTALKIEDVLAYIKDNGLFVSKRWRIGEEDVSGKLYLRDATDTTADLDARYSFRTGVAVNL
jgi:hypothetical protein